jgi:hypothetical protein
MLSRFLGRLQVKIRAFVKTLLAAGKIFSEGKRLEVFMKKA